MFVRVGATAYAANSRMAGDRSSRPVALLVSHDFMASVTYVDVICSLHVSTHKKKCLFYFLEWRLQITPFLKLISIVSPIFILIPDFSVCFTIRVVLLV